MKPREKLERVRGSIEHVRQAQVVGMLIQMPIVVAHKADCAAADGVGLTVKDMDARAMLNNHDFMKIMMMLRESRHYWKL